MSAEQFESFEEFWPYYVREHQNETNRILHAVGTACAASALAAGLLSGRRWWLLLAPIVGYGPAWIGHFFVEHNTPATFQHPLWSLRGDLRMLRAMLSGTMDDEVERAVRERQDGASPRGHGANGESVRVEVAQPAPSDPHSIN